MAHHTEPSLVTAPDSLLAPAFTAIDLEDRAVALADYHGRQNVILVFNRGFA